MSIASAIQTKQQQVAAAYTAASGKGATMPVNENLTNLATCIGSIPAGGSTRAFPANYWVDTSGNVHNIGNDVNNTALSVAGGVLSTNATQITIARAYEQAYKSKIDIVKVDLSAVTSISGEDAFSSAFMFSSLTAIDLSSLKEISGNYAFFNAFQNCRITELSFPALSSVTGSCFSNMLMNVTGCTLHFPSNMETTIGNLTGFPSFGGTNINVYFDLPAVS